MFECKYENILKRVYRGIAKNKQLRRLLFKTLRLKVRHRIDVEGALGLPIMKDAQIVRYYFLSVLRIN